MHAVTSSTVTHTVSSRSVTCEVCRTGTGLSAEGAKTSWTTGWKTHDTRWIHTQDTVAFPPEIKAYHQLLNDVALTFGAVGCSPARQTFTVTITGVAGGVVGTLIAHFRTHLAVVASRTNCKTLLEEVRLSLNIKNICVDLHVQLLIPNLDHSWHLCDLAGSRTLLSHGGSGRTGHRMGMTCCTGHHRYQLCILGDKETKSVNTRVFVL